MAKSILGGVEIINTLSTKNDGAYPLVKAESVGMNDGATAEDSIKKKLDKNQGAKNNGKFMKVGADGNLVPENVPVPDVSGQINSHNTNNESHTDIRELVAKLTERLNTLMDSEDVSLDQLSEIVSYIKNNKTLIEQVTTNKLNVTDVVNNLTTNVESKALSAAMGVELKRLIDSIKTTDASAQISEHDKSKTAHADIRTDVTTLKEANAQLKEDLKSKLDKNQGAENNGKILGIGADGVVVPVEKPSGGTGGGVDLDATLTSPDKAAPANLVGELKREKADAIVSSASGEQIVLTDSDNESFKGSHVYGKSTQVTTTGAQLFDVDAGGTGWLNRETGAFVVNNNSNYVSEYIPVKSGAQYYINYDISQYVYSYDSSKQFLRKETYKNSFAVGDDVFYIRFAISADKEGALKKAKTIMLNEGSSAKPYEPYTGGKPSPSIEYPQEIVSAGDKGSINVDVLSGNLIPETQIVDVSFNKKEEPQILTLKTPNGLPGIPVSTGGNYTDSNGQQWVCDEKDLAREKYVQRVEKAKFDGSADESWAASNSHLGNRYVSIPLKNRSKSQYDVKIICNIAFPKLWNVEKTCFINEYKYFSYYDNSAPASIFENVDNFKQWLIENPIEILYILETPIERDLTPEEIQAYKALHTNYPTTVIMNDENAGMKVSYVADTKHYIDKKFKELNQAIVNTQISLL